MSDFIRPARGARRLTDIAALPCRDSGCEIRYFGSISKSGDNADWDWGMYKDANNEWVLAEADGAGCIFNFTQHRYPTSEIPTFKFYFDNSDVPQFEITPPEFGKKAPFLSPLADYFDGPEDNGRGPIRVVRSFVPMEFRTHCKVTSTVKLEGCEKSLGQGGWGHITMHLYDRPEGLVTFSQEKAVPADIFRNPVGLPADCEEEKSLLLSNEESVCIYRSDRLGCICKINVSTEQFTPETLQKLWIVIKFDGVTSVRSPFGTFFGCEYGNTPALLETSLLTCDIRGEKAFFENRFPMPYFSAAEIYIENNCGSAVPINTVVGENHTLHYDPLKTYRFTASDYYPKTPNILGKNSVIADICGAGQMVYGVISGEEIECGCEGDVRVFIDGVESPAVESDGSESWGSYGWGFVCPPQVNPFSAYNGVPESNSTWSELRLTFTDSYPFRSRLRFELEHGCQNDGGGFHSGQLFFYRREEPCEKFLLEINADSDYYNSDGQIETVTDRFENGIHENFKTFHVNRNMTFTSFRVSLPEINCGLVLKRVCLQQNGRMEAQVFIDGEPVERKWIYPDSNTFYRLLEDSFTVPSRFTAEKKELTVEIRPISGDWNECRYRVFAIE